MSPSTIWSKYKEILIHILESYRSGNEYVEMKENKLLYINDKYPAITWMNAQIESRAVTPRFGYVVEVNALWYNAIKFTLELATLSKDKSFINAWAPIADEIPLNFQKTFWDEEQNCLADYVANGIQNKSIRPNQIIAASLRYTPLTEAMIKCVLDTIQSQLLTPKGLRSLSPQDPLYKGKYFGNFIERDRVLHQGTVWPWFLGHFADAYLKIYKSSGIEFIQSSYENFKEEMTENAIGTVPEFYEGDPPHYSRGAISFAASVAELIRMKEMIQRAKEKP
jgi:predicted glycogen debranching enzyme